MEDSNYWTHINNKTECGICTSVFYKGAEIARFRQWGWFNDHSDLVNNAIEGHRNETAFDEGCLHGLHA